MMNNQQLKEKYEQLLGDLCTVRANIKLAKREFPHPDIERNLIDLKKREKELQMELSQVKSQLGRY